MTVPQYMLAAAMVREVFLPEFHDLDNTKKVKMVSKLRSHWPTRVKTQQKLAARDLVECARDLANASHHYWEDGNVNCLALYAVRIFGDDSDLMALGDHGIPKVGQVILTMAEHIFRLSKLQGNHCRSGPNGSDAVGGPWRLSGL